MSPSNIQNILRQTCSRKVRILKRRRTHFTVVREVLHNHYRSHNLIGPYYWTMPLNAYWPSEVRILYFLCVVTQSWATWFIVFVLPNLIFVHLCGCIIGVRVNCLLVRNQDEGVWVPDHVFVYHMVWEGVTRVRPCVYGVWEGVIRVRVWWSKSIVLKVMQLPLQQCLQSYIIYIPFTLVS